MRDREHITSVQLCFVSWQMLKSIFACSFSFSQVWGVSVHAFHSCLTHITDKQESKVSKLKVKTSYMPQRYICVCMWVCVCVFAHYRPRQISLWIRMGAKQSSAGKAIGHVNTWLWPNMTLTCYMAKVGQSLLRSSYSEQHASSVKKLNSLFCYSFAFNGYVEFVF